MICVWFSSCVSPYFWLRSGGLSPLACCFSKQKETSACVLTGRTEEPAKAEWKRQPHACASTGLAEGRRGVRFGDPTCWAWVPTESKRMAKGSRETSTHGLSKQLQSPTLTAKLAGQTRSKRWGFQDLHNQTTAVYHPVTYDATAQCEPGTRGTTPAELGKGWNSTKGVSSYFSGWREEKFGTQMK